MVNRTDRICHVLESPYDVYIGDAVEAYNFEASDWRNPYKIKPAGPFTRLESYEMYKERLRRLGLLERIPELSGKVLGCWCKSKRNPYAPCHGDILLQLVTDYEEKSEWERLTDDLINSIKEN